MGLLSVIVVLISWVLAWLIRKFIPHGGAYFLALVGGGVSGFVTGHAFSVLVGVIHKDQPDLYNRMTMGNLLLGAVTAAFFAWMMRPKKKA